MDEPPSSSEDDDNGSTRNKNDQQMDNLNSLMDQVRILNNSPTKKHTAALRSCPRGGINSLSFDSDPSDDDSDSTILEPFVPTFKRKTSKNIDDTDAGSLGFMEESESGESFQSTKKSFSSNSEAEEDDSPDKKWSYNRKTNAFSVSSTDAVRMPKLIVPKKLFEKLFDYQKDGVIWMAGLHHQKIGGLLGDDMGLGKTFQTLTLLGGLMKAKTIRNALVIAPLSVLRSWEREAHNVARACVPHMQIQVISSDIPKATRSRRLLHAMQW
eukprot:scaffold6162_cov154-Cylindrotheca_fusiformis.AAC.10